MPILRLATRRETRNPVRVQQWNATLRAGDDFKLALTVYTDDSGVAAPVAGSNSQILLWPDMRRWDYTSWDYGLGWFSGATLGPGFPTQTFPGFVTPVRAGGINFAIPGSVSGTFAYGRYRLSVQIDLADGEFSQVEGVLQVRGRWPQPGLGHAVPSAAALAGFNQVNGQPVDPDGFFLLSPNFGPGITPDLTDQTGNPLTDQVGNPIPIV